MPREAAQKLSELPSADAATPSTSEAQITDGPTGSAPASAAPTRAAPIRCRYLLIAGLLFAASTAGIWLSSGHDAPMTMEEALVGTASGGNEYQSAEAISTASANRPSNSTASSEASIQGQPGVCASSFERDMDYYNGRVSAADSQPLLVHRQHFSPTDLPCTSITASSGLMLAV